MRWIRGLLLLSAVIPGSTYASIPEDPGPHWASRYDGHQQGYDAAAALVTSPDGSKVFVTGYSRGPEQSSDASYATIAYSGFDGAELWTASFDRPDYGYEVPSAIAVSPDGSKVFVTGSSRRNYSSEFATVAYSETGTQLWTAFYRGPLVRDAATSVAVSPDGSTVFVTGASSGLDGSADYATIAYSATTGAALWTARYAGPVSDSDIPVAIAAAADGSKVVVTGYSWAGAGLTNSPDYATIAYSPTTGAQLWFAAYDGPTSGDWATSLALTPDSSKVFVTGRSYGENGTNDFMTIAYSASGAPLWMSRYDGPSRRHDYPSKLTVSPDGTKVFVVGYSLDINAKADYTALAYSASSGEQLWLATYDGPDHQDDGATSVAVDVSGSKVFVTGYSSSSNGSVFSTIAYAAATGSHLWTDRYSGAPGEDAYPSSIATSPDGSGVFVTGTSYISNSSADYLTIAFPTTRCSNGGNESGPISTVVHDSLEPQLGPLYPYAHGVNCDVLVPGGL